MSFTCIDLFAGCGGLSLGLSQAGFEHLFAIEAHPHAFATYYQNLIKGKAYYKRWPNWLEKGPHDIVNVLMEHGAHLEQLKGKVDLVAGGPPCQGFSMNGRRDPEDPRSQMVNAYFDFVNLIRPKIVLLENVQGFLSMPHSKHGTFPGFAKARLAELEYDAFETIVPASDFGVPQKRPRYILIGVKAGTLPGVNPVERLRVGRRRFLDRLGIGQVPTSAVDALGDLETAGRELVADPEFGASGFKCLKYSPPSAESPYLRLMRDGSKGCPTDMRLANHSEKIVGRLKDILANCKRGQAISVESRLRYGIKKRSVTPLDPSVPAPTITTLPDDLVHYSEPRTMTVREHARLQSFPDWFQFSGPYTTGGPRRKHDCPRYTQVGNAVPPLLARAVGETILSLLGDQKARNFPHGTQILKETASMLGEISNGHIRLSVTVQD